MSWRTAEVELRGRYSIAGSELASRLAGLRGLEEVREGCVLSTCNRTEVLVAAPPTSGLERELRRQFFAGARDDAVYVYRGIHAVIHLFRVAAGLDSLVMGESEILGQLKEAITGAREAGALGRSLEPLLRQSLSVGKRTRNETRIGSGSLSVARVGVELAERVFGGFADCRGLIVGAGDTARLVGRHLRHGGIRALALANRTPERAREAAAELGADARGLDAVAELLRDTDCLFACVDGAGALVGRDAFDGKRLAKRDRPFLVVDLSVPRAVDRAVAEHPNVLYYDLDDVQRIVEQNDRGRRQATAESSDILLAELHKFISLRTFAAFSPAISELRRRFESVRDEVLDECAGASASPDQMRVAHQLTARLLDVALTQMKEGARHASPEEALGVEYREFLENL